jgi:hypothetical protein
MVEPPYATVVSIRPHLSAPINQDLLDLFSEVVPPLLPDK